MLGVTNKKRTTIIVSRATGHVKDWRALGDKSGDFLLA